jgi:hypothetical protein
LGNILRIVGVAQKAEGGVPGGGLMPAHKLLEGGQVALSHVQHQFFVATHVFPS